MQAMTIQLTFTPDIQEALHYERYHHPVPLVQRRMEVLWLKSHGLAPAMTNTFSSRRGRGAQAKLHQHCPAPCTGLLSGRLTLDAPACLLL